MKKLIRVKYMGPTNTKGSRIKITDTFENVSVIRGYDYTKDTIAEMAIEYLVKFNNGKKKDIEILLSNDSYYYLAVPSKYKIKVV